MKILIASIITTTVVTPLVAVCTCYYFKNDILKFYDETLSDFFGDSIRTRRTLGRAARVLPLTNYPVAPKKEKFVLPAYLASLSYLTPVCLKPTHERKPLKNKFFSLKLVKFFTTFLFIKQKSPPCFGTSISLSFEYIS